MKDVVLHNCPKCNSMEIVRFESVGEMQTVNPLDNYSDYTLECIEDDQIPCGDLYVCFTCYELFSHE